MAVTNARPQSEVVSQNPIQAKAEQALGKAPVSRDKTALSRMLEHNRDEQYNMFMKMFLAQVKNQSVDNPMSTHEMTQSVMSFFQAAEQAQTNKLLKQSNDLKVKDHMAMAKTYINKEIDYQGNAFVFKGDPVDVRVAVPADAKEAELYILTSDPKTGNLAPIKTIALKKEAGEQKIVWDGTTDKDPQTKVPNGPYYVKIIAKDKNGNEKYVPTTLRGKVNQVNYDTDEGQVQLLLDDIIGVDLDHVRSVRKLKPTDMAELNSNMQQQIKQFEELNKLIKDQTEPLSKLESTEIPSYIN